MLKKAAGVLLFATLISLAVPAAAAGLVDQLSALSGKVSAHKLVMAGERVKEGQPLLYIESITGPVPAARASTDGVIAAVLVGPGEQITGRQVVARLRTDS